MTDDDRRSNELVAEAVVARLEGHRPLVSAERDPMDLLTPDQVADVLNVNKQFVYRQYEQGALEGILLTRRALRFERRAVTAFVDSRRKGRPGVASPGD